MIRVLFVDDEPNVLRGIQRMLAGAGFDWETAFAGSGREALAVLAERPFDVVISDMRMPEMDGAALLNEVRARHPDIARIVLSGHSEQSLVLRSVVVAHRYLAKPCEQEDLYSAVTRTVALREVLAAPSLRACVSQLHALPSMPRVYQDLMEQIQCPQASLKEVGMVVSRDVGMTAKVLQIVNSAFFGMPRHVPDPVQAVCLLGLDVLKALVMTAHVFSEMSADTVADLGLSDLWAHSIETGMFAKKIATLEKCERGTRDHALMAGLLHDSGKLVLAANQTRDYRRVCELTRTGGLTLLEAEHKVFGTTHAEIGAYLLGLWGLPDLVIEAVAFHHRLEKCGAGANSPLVAVHAASVLQHALHEPDDGTPPLGLDAEYLQRVGLAERWPVWRNECLAGTCR